MSIFSRCPQCHYNSFMQSFVYKRTSRQVVCYMGKDVNLVHLSSILPLDLNCGHLIAKLVHENVVFFSHQSLRKKVQHFTICNGS